MYRSGLGGGQQGWQGIEEKVPGCNVGKYQTTNSLVDMGTDRKLFLIMESGRWSGPLSSCIRPSS